MLTSYLVYSLFEILLRQPVVLFLILIICISIWGAVILGRKSEFEKNKVELKKKSEIISKIIRMQNENLLFITELNDFLSDSATLEIKTGVIMVKEIIYRSKKTTKMVSALYERVNEMSVETDIILFENILKEVEEEEINIDHTRLEFDKPKKMMMEYRKKIEDKRE